MAPSVLKNMMEQFVEQGLLDLSVQLSTRDVTAGKKITLFLIVRNPYKTPVWVRQVHVSLPSDLALSHIGRDSNPFEGFTQLLARSLKDVNRAELK